MKKINQIYRAIRNHLIRTANQGWQRGLRDPRKRRGRRWELKTLLTALWAGMLTGMKNLRAVEALTERMGCRVPDTTLVNLLNKMKPGILSKNIVIQVREAYRAKEMELTTLPFHMVAIDGKCIWVGKHKAHRNCQQVTHSDGKTRYLLRMLRAVWVSGAAKLCLGQRPIPGSQNDMSAFANFFNQLVKAYGKGKLLSVVSCDAGFCSLKNASLINKHELGYLIALKSPQRDLLWEAKRLLGDLPISKADAISDWELYQGKRIRRHLFRTNEIAGWGDWSHLRQVWRIRQETEHPDGRREVEERYFITNLVPGITKGSWPLKMVRAHWGIENNANWTFDTQWGEDKHPWCSAALEVLSLMRIMAYNVMQRLRVRRLRTEANRKRSWSNLQALVTDVLIFLGLGWLLIPSNKAEFIAPVI